MTGKPFLYAALLLLTQCSKCKQDDPSPESQLPPATQTGANTFGCLVNGQVYLPSGNNGTANYAVLYEPGFQGGTLQIYTYRYPEPKVAKTQEVSLGGINIDHIGAYELGLNKDVGASFIDDHKLRPCNEYRSDQSTVYSRGSLTITRLDLTAGIISGTFAFTLAQPGCDTIKVTQGRFDKKL
ncbi:hypothetical protein E5K00_13280 [Hymenobacter aquaticus]|uniref:Uncharacterized protein n=1 Tax=Hymenobacter aquaticus TaxID=1867101 RepID=A0A4Z0PWC9_9BACT|nr:DUF6252 family protein [Hymenobacter aquaticus]TGE21261.1 hypothetical protein E5K00_13280 [Hymenobacter aquaticus]